MKNFTVFANFYIDTEERFLRLKDSFFSFDKANISEWVINTRGKYKEDVKNFLEKNVKTDLKLFFLESKNGWVNDTIKITEAITNEIIFIWVEDHICTTDISQINLVVDEMYKNDVDHLIYSFFHKGIFIKPLEAVDYNEDKNISYFVYDKINYNNLKKWYESNEVSANYLISLCSFMSLDLFKKNLSLSKEKKKYHRLLPFNFEKSFREDEILPFKNGVVKKELFVSIDDNHGEEGYSLISRKKYANRASKKKMDEIRSSKIKIFDNNILNKIKDKIFNFIRK